MKWVTPILFLMAVGLWADPSAEVKELEYDFGKIKEGEVINHVFYLKNVGTDTLIIGRVHSSCGCTAALVSNDEIAPGDSAEIKATFRSKGFSGKVEKKIYVDTNDPAHYRITYKIKGEVIPKPAPEAALSQTVMEVGTLEVGTVETLRVYLKNTGQKDLTVDGVETTGLDVLPPFFPEPIPPGDSVALNFQLKAEKPGKLSNLVTVITNARRHSRVFLRVRGYVKGEEEEKE